MTGAPEHASMKRRPGRPRKADAVDTKEALRHAALRLFARKGYAGTSIRAIAGEVGLSESVLYAHYPNKQAIFDAILAEHGPQRPVDAPPHLDAELVETDPPAYLRALAHAFVEEWGEEDARLAVSLMTRDGLLHSPRLRQALTATRDAVADLFARWMASGHMRTDLGPPEDVALSFTGPIGLTRLLRLHADASDADRATARDEISRHVETFIKAAFVPV